MLVNIIIYAYSNMAYVREICVNILGHYWPWTENVKFEAYIVLLLFHKEIGQSKLFTTHDAN